MLNPRMILTLIGLIFVFGLQARKDWQTLGNKGFSEGIVDKPSLAFSPSGTPYVAYEDAANGDRLTVEKFQNGEWMAVDTPGFTSNSVAQPTLAFPPNSATPHVVFSNGGIAGFATVVKYNGSQWVTVGPDTLSRSDADEPDLAFSTSGTPYIAFQDRQNTDGITVKKFASGQWDTVGQRDFTPGTADNLSFELSPSSNTPYVAFRDRDNNDGATVMKFDGGNWSYVGNVAFSEGQVLNNSLAFSPNSQNPYVAYLNFARSSATTVRSFNGSSWIQVGQDSISKGNSTYQSLAFSADGTPYVAYKDNANDFRATVLRYDGIEWVNVGIAGFTEQGISKTSLAFPPSGNDPYLAYEQSFSTGNGVAVQSYKCNTFYQPVASFDYSTDGLTAQFTDLSVNVNNHEWFFGDNTTDTKQNPTHTYQDTGTYQVCLTITNNCSTDSICRDVTLSKTTTGLQDKSGNKPISQLYPNPTDGQVELRYVLDQSTEINFSIYDQTGKRTSTLVDEYKAPGVHTHTFDLTSLAPGVYFYKLETSHDIQSGKVIKTE